MSKPRRRRKIGSGSARRDATVASGKRRRSNAPPAVPGPGIPYPGPAGRAANFVPPFPTPHTPRRRGDRSG